MQTPYFQLEQVGAGTWAALVIEGTGAWGNAGIVDLGDQTLVFDTFNTPSAARALCDAAVAVTGRRPGLVINSHGHADHIYGNQVFGGVPIIATEATRQLMETRCATFLQRQKEKDGFAAYIDQVAQAGQQAQDPRKQREAELLVGEYRALLAEVDAVELKLPTLTFTRELTLHGSQRSASLRSYGGGHTASDSFLWLPDQGILFAADLIQVGFHPAMPPGNPREWDRILAEISELNVRFVIPGHGSAVGGRESIDVMRQYIADLFAIAGDAASNGGKPEEAAGVPIPPAYADWGAPTVFGQNLAFLVRQAQQN